MELRENVSELRGVLVVAYEEGLQLGKVCDIYIEKQAKQIMGISFKGGLLGLEKESFVSFENIRKLGKDVVIISGEAQVKPLPKELKKSGLKAMKGFKITTHDGAHIGELIDLNVIKDDGKISELILDEGKMLKVEVGDITSGQDIIMVPVDYAARIKAIEEEKSGLLARMPAKGVVKDTFKGAVEKVGDTIGRILKKDEPEAAPADKDLQKNESQTTPADNKPQKDDTQTGVDDKKPDG
ncbi:MAG: PRC-barrel domain-containing protein [Deltaproteobacteria bacterium]|nr:PRC-barrel domain-containing protein [Deltaproteobacteria bacterium]